MVSSVDDEAGCGIIGLISSFMVTCFSWASTALDDLFVVLVCTGFIVAFLEKQRAELNGSLSKVSTSSQTEIKKVHSEEVQVGPEVNTVFTETIHVALSEASSNTYPCSTSVSTTQTDSTSLTDADTQVTNSELQLDLGDAPPSFYERMKAYVSPKKSNPLMAALGSPRRSDSSL